MQYSSSAASLGNSSRASRRPSYGIHDGVHSPRMQSNQMLKRQLSQGESMF